MVHVFVCLFVVFFYNKAHEVRSKITPDTDGSQYFSDESYHVMGQTHLTHAESGTFVSSQMRLVRSACDTQTYILQGPMSKELCGGKEFALLGLAHQGNHLEPFKAVAGYNISC